MLTNGNRQQTFDDYLIYDEHLNVIKNISDIERMRLFQIKTFGYTVKKYPELCGLDHDKILELLYKYHDDLAGGDPKKAEELRYQFIVNHAQKWNYSYSENERKELKEKYGRPERVSRY